MEAMTNKLRADLPELPGRISRLPIDARGYPIPWFVAWENGQPEFRAGDGRKFVEAINGKLCWVCGQPLGRYLAFLLGPMCVVNRISAEPPCHRDCAEFSLKACPFLSKPQMVRRENDLPADLGHAGIMIQRNPGVSILWITHSYTIRPDSNGGVLLHVGDPTEMVPYREGRTATADEVRESFESGLPNLARLAAAEGDLAIAQLGVYVTRARHLLKIA